ncbi:MAG: leucine-rich repeat domain-containing protein [Promethearchaeota archaeon]
MTDVNKVNKTEKSRKHRKLLEFIIEPLQTSNSVSMSPMGLMITFKYPTLEEALNDAESLTRFFLDHGRIRTDFPNYLQEVKNIINHVYQHGKFLQNTQAYRYGVLEWEQYDNEERGSFGTSPSMFRQNQINGGIIRIVNALKRNSHPKVNGFYFQDNYGQDGYDIASHTMNFFTQNWNAQAYDEAYHQMVPSEAMQDLSEMIEAYIPADGQYIPAKFASGSAKLIRGTDGDRYGGDPYFDGLSLENCGLESLPGSFTQFQEINHLNLRGNNFQTVPPQIFSLQNLKKLFMSNNNLPEEIQREINRNEARSKKSSLGIILNHYAHSKSLEEYYSALDQGDWPTLFDKVNPNLYQHRTEILAYAEKFSHSGAQQFKALLNKYAMLDEQLIAYEDFLLVRQLEREIKHEFQQVVEGSIPRRRVHIACDSLVCLIDDDGHVIGLGLQNLDLTRIPDALWELKNLKFVNMGHNQITSLNGMIKSEILDRSYFHNSFTLILDHNQLPAPFQMILDLLAEDPESNNSLNYIRPIVKNRSRTYEEFKKICQSKKGNYADMRYIKSLRDKILIDTKSEQAKISPKIAEMLDWDYYQGIPMEPINLKIIREINMSLTEELQLLPNSLLKHHQGFSADNGKITNLNVSNFNLSKLPKEINSLQGLRYLNISHNAFEKMPIEFDLQKKIFDFNFEGNKIPFHSEFLETIKRCLINKPYSFFLKRNYSYYKTIIRRNRRLDVYDKYNLFLLEFSDELRPLVENSNYIDKERMLNFLSCQNFRGTMVSPNTFKFLSEMEPILEFQITFHTDTRRILNIDRMYPLHYSQPINSITLLDGKIIDISLVSSSEVKLPLSILKLVDLLYINFQDTVITNPTLLLQLPSNPIRPIIDGLNENSKYFFTPGILNIHQKDAQKNRSSNKKKSNEEMYEYLQLQKQIDERNIQYFIERIKQNKLPDDFDYKSPHIIPFRKELLHHCNSNKNLAAKRYMEIFDCRFRDQVLYQQDYQALMKFQQNHPNISISLEEKPLKRVYSRSKSTSIEPNSNSITFLIKEHQIIGIDINNAELKEIPPEFSQCLLLNKINLSHNQISSTADLRVIPEGCQILILHHNIFTNFPKNIPHHIQELDFSDNLLENPDYSQLPTSLTKLKLNNCGLSQFPSPLPPTLETLILSHNSIEAIPSIKDILPKLVSIHLGNNQISVYPETLHHCKSLEYINLANNLLNSFPDKIKLTSPLNSIDLSSNKLETLPQFLYQKAIDTYIEINLHSNKLHTFTQFPPLIGWFILSKNRFPEPIQYIIDDWMYEGFSENEPIMNRLKEIFTRDLTYYLAKIDRGEDFDTMDFNNPYLVEFKDTIIDHLKDHRFKNKFVTLKEFLQFPIYHGCFLHPEDLAVIQNLKPLVHKTTFTFQYSKLWHDNKDSYYMGGSYSLIDIFDGRIVSLLIDGIKTSTFPLEILNLSNLEELSISYTEIAALPLEMIKLVNLKSLVLHESQIEEYPYQLLLCPKMKEIIDFQNFLPKMKEEFEQESKNFSIKLVFQKIEKGEELTLIEHLHSEICQYRDHIQKLCHKHDSSANQRLLKWIELRCSLPLSDKYRIVL